MKNSYGDYSRIFEQLKLWSLGGISEHRAFARYEAQLALTKRELRRFYSKKYRWSSGTSDRLATDALEFAISRGIGFYMYEPFPAPNEVDLREAILQHRPMRDVQAIRVDKLTMTRVLDSAVRYPEALRHLLVHGADPNATNGFGKTPLMYAVQYNQPKATKILLAHGADPNAATTWPDNDCIYALSTARITPLHYAVRYASERVIRLLLVNSALTFGKTEKRLGDGEYPLDWLRNYTDAAAIERNAHLSKADVPKLAALLRVPEAVERAAIAADLTKRAEAEYAAGNVEKSYRQLMAALSAKPDNEQALNDLPLVALKSGRLGQSVEAAETVLRKVTNPELRASAWFNKGLACEQKGEGFLIYNGRYYCNREGLVSVFLEAWKLGPSDARKNKLRTLFKDGLPRTCTINKRGMPQHFRFDSDSSPRIYAYHVSRETIDAASISWTIQVSDSSQQRSIPTVIRPRLVERYDFGEFAITELEADFVAQGPVSIGDQTCSPFE